MRLISLLMFVINTSGWKLSPFRYDSYGPYVMDIYLNGAPNNIPTADMLNLIDEARRSWNRIPRNRVQIEIGKVIPPGIPCKEVSESTTIYTREGSESRFGVICFEHTDAGAAQTRYTNSPHSTSQQQMFRGASVFLNTKLQLNKETTYNILLHELGHVNLLKHPDENWVFLKHKEYELPIMLMKLDFISNRNRYKHHDQYYELAIDDVAAVMYRNPVW